MSIFLRIGFSALAEMAHRELSLNGKMKKVNARK
jgi:hypothetical protein